MDHRPASSHAQFDLVTELEHYRMRFPGEADTVTVFLEFVRRTPDHFLREHLPGHMTGSAFVIDDGCTETLLVHHRKLGLWVQPGGHADGNTDLAAVAEQELVEETGITAFSGTGPAIFDLDRHTIPARGGVPEHYHYDVRFLFRAKRDQRLVISSESHDVRWFALAALMSGDPVTNGVRTDESVRRMARKATGGPGKPE